MDPDFKKCLVQEGFDDSAIEIFKKEKIDRRVVVTLDNDDLKDLGFVALGDRKRVKSLIARLTSEEREKVEDPVVMIANRENSTPSAETSLPNDSLDSASDEDDEPARVGGSSVKAQVSRCPLTESNSNTVCFKYIVYTL